MEAEDDHKQDSREKEEEEGEEDEVPSLPLGLTGILCSLFPACAKSHGLTLYFRARCGFQVNFINPRYNCRAITAISQLLMTEI